MSRSPDSFCISRSAVIRFFLISLPLAGAFVFLLVPFNLWAYSFKGQLVENNTKTFHHWNAKKEKITGYTILSYETDLNSGELLETSRNMTNKQKVYLEKTIWFDLQTGELKKYQESDFRTDIKIINSYTNDRILTEVWEKGVKKDFKIKITSDLVPFEVLSHYLQAKIDNLQKKKSIRFTLYLPIIALELTNKGLPLSLSQLGMKASIIKIKDRDTIFGKKEVITVRVEPTSFFIKALLPSEKSRFDFYFISQQPNTLIQFEEGDTRTTLIKSE